MVVFVFMGETVFQLIEFQEFSVAENHQDLAVFHFPDCDTVAV